LHQPILHPLLAVVVTRRKHSCRNRICQYRMSRYSIR
jgi:hypothetical protein